MDKGTELTNVPDYQKIIQTAGSQGSINADHNSSNWGDGIDTLPQPTIRHPLVTGGTDQQHYNYGKYPQDSWDNKRALSGTAIVVDGNRASWDSPTQYDASKYGIINNSASMASFKDEPTYIPQGYTRPVTKYVDANGVEHRVIRRSFSPNRRSFNEGLILKDDPIATSSGLRAASSQTNLHHNYTSPTLNLKRIVGNFSEGREGNPLRSGFGKRNYLTQSMEYLAKSPLSGNESGGSSVVGKSPQDNLRHWQQQHQEELLHQHLETQALYEIPNNQSAHFDPTSGRGLLQDESQARWEPVRRAADSIIKEKNMIIDKLKNRILELEEDFKVSEDKLRLAVASKGDDVDIVKQKLQEVQHKNAVLKEQLNEERAKKNSELDDLDMKLGSAEYEAQQLKEVLRNKDLGLSDVQTQLEDKMKEVEAWRQKFVESCSSHQEMKRRLDGLQRYLDDLPTVEESRLQAQQILSLREENFALKAKCESQEKKLIQVRKTLTARDFRVRELEGQEKDLEKKIQEVTLELDRLRDNEGSELYKAQQELSNANGDTNRLVADLERAKKLLETTHARLRQVEIKCQTEQRAVQERLALEEQTIVSLRAEAAAKDGQIEKMNKSLKELGVRNQDLFEQYLVVKEQMRKMEGKASDVGTALHHRFMQQLRLCVADLQALVRVCSQCASGETPDISALLGVKNLENEEPQEGAAGGEPSLDATKTITQWLNQLGQLRKEIEKLRAHICNKYAEDMGDNITCATQ